MSWLFCFQCCNTLRGNNYDFALVVDSISKKCRKLAILKKLGAKTSKSIPQNLLGIADNDANIQELSQSAN